MTNSIGTKENQSSVIRTHPQTEGHTSIFLQVVRSKRAFETKEFAIGAMQKLNMIDAKVQAEFSQIFKDEGMKPSPSLPFLKLLATKMPIEMLTDIQGAGIHRKALEVVERRIEELSKVTRK
ncbi:MAG: hypothetical protein KGH71_03600 [Candidatus Micrarchaeota archaeon]|nr:hypothetical protein [Candidatus Micrarchaeota archaeon]